MPYLALLPPDAAQRKYDLREVFNALRWMARTGAQWQYIPHDFPPPNIVNEQARRWMRRGVFEDLVHDLREMLRLLSGRNVQPSAAIYDGRTLQSSPESGERAGYDGAKRRKGGKVHMAVDTLGHLLALVVTPANEQERAQVAALSQAVQEVTNQKVEIAFVDQGYTGPQAEQAAEEEGIELCVVKLEDASTSLTWIHLNVGCCEDEQGVASVLGSGGTSTARRDGPQRNTLSAGDDSRKNPAAGGSFRREVAALWSGCQSAGLRPDYGQRYLSPLRDGRAQGRLVRQAASRSSAQDHGGG